MGSSIFSIVCYVLGGGILGAAAAWQIQVWASNRRMTNAKNMAQAHIDDITSQRNQFANEYAKARDKVKSLQATVATRNTELAKRVTELAKRNTEIASVLEKSKLLAGNVRTLRTERANTKTQISTILKALESVKQQTSALQTEFEKAQEFYKRELLKSFEKRKLLEKEIKAARADQEALTREVESAVTEAVTAKAAAANPLTAKSGKAEPAPVKPAAAKPAPPKQHSSDEMVAEAKLRLGQLEVLERNVNKLEAENAEMNDDISRLKKEIEERDRNLAELEELRVNNRQLVRCVEALEGSRKEYESDAERYKAQADQSEQMSDTLRFKLDDLQKNFAEIEEQQGKALTNARKASVVPLMRNQG